MAQDVDFEADNPCSLGIALAVLPLLVTSIFWGQGVQIL
jgi:hypothetical protein